MRDTATMVNGFDISFVDALDPELRQIVERRASLLGPAYKLFSHPEPGAGRPGRGRAPVRRGRAGLPGRLQQRAVGRALPPAGGRGDRAPGGHPRHAHRVRQRAHPRLRRAAARHVPGRPRPRHVHLHRQRGGRPGAAHRTLRDRRRGDRHHRQRLPRRDHGRRRVGPRRPGGRLAGPCGPTPPADEDPENPSPTGVRRSPR